MVINEMQTYYVFRPAIHKYYTILVKKKQLTIEKFIRISDHQMVTSSSSLAEFLAGTPFDALHQCFSCLFICIKQASV
jgi:hypothetical protein